MVAGTETENGGTVDFRSFVGLNNRLPPERLAMNELATALNIDLDDSGGARRRSGYAQVIPGRCHSLWAQGTTAFVVQDEELMLLRPDLSLVPLGVTGLSSINPLSYVLINGTTYFSNGIVTGAIQNGAARTWGLAVPGIPAAVGIPGNLPAGTYGFTATTLRNDGQESGAGNIQTRTLPAGSGLQWSIAASPDPTVQATRIYLTPPNSSMLFLAAEIAGTAKVGQYTGNGTDLTVPLWTQFMGPPPAGTVLAAYNGRLLIAEGQLLWYTEPLGYELLRADENFLWFASPITLVAPVAEGVFLGTEDEIVFLEGMDVAKSTRLPKASYGAIRNTLVYTDGSLVGGGQFTSTVALWCTPQGVCAGGNKGFIKGTFDNLTQGRVSLPVATLGAALFRQSNGINQYVAMLQNGNGEAQNAFVGDDVTATVIRNGVIIPLT